MKKYIRLISILLILWITGCNKFLDVTPKNVISMDDLQSIKQALSGFLNGMRVDGGNSYNFENPVSPLEPSNREGVLLAYCEEWDLSELAADNEGMTVEDIKKVDWRDETTQGYWGRFYQTIGFMNLILHEAETATGDEDMRDYIMGEAYVMRAYCFFKLVQYYAPYDNNDLGIPLCLNSYDDFEDVNLSRAPQTKVYAQILSDLHEAEIRLERTPMRNGFNVMYKSSVLNRLFAQVYQFKALSPAAEANDWQNAALYASKETRNATLDGIDVLYSIFSVNNTKEVMNNETALRIFFSMGYPKSSMFNGMELSTDFYESYFSVSEGDIRRDFIEEINVYDWKQGKYVLKLLLNKFDSDYIYGDYGSVFVGFRLAEAFLIQAEALAMTEKLDEAKAILERFKEDRYEGTYTTPSDKEGLLKDIYRERRKEFMGEGDYGWLDIKRLGLKVERTIDGKTYTLDGKGDYRYTFPIPTMELENNKFIDQNPGWHLTE
ncbi:RagB/SusD family nutrient uptake outer membrane protein [Butyricimonas sp.]|uniref:RagB/SusD family nutrient uptake outer membrane protein n=1 Tax=Butyricimonas sp. TaxID=1969738 RepID=UPI0025C5E403|nr:RagB/SusD family nutrient uptake outer membrane protein [Butyricimonas sp.]